MGFSWESGSVLDRVITYSSCSCELLMFPQTGPLGFHVSTQIIKIELMPAMWRNGLWNLASIIQECGSRGKVRIHFSRGAFSCLRYELIHQTAFPFFISNTIPDFYNKNCEQYSTYSASLWFSLTQSSVAPQSPLNWVPCPSKSESPHWISPFFFVFHSHNFPSANFFSCFTSLLFVM